MPCWPLEKLGFDLQTIYRLKFGIFPNFNQQQCCFFIQLFRYKLLIYIDSTTSINKGEWKKVRIVIPVVVGSSPISHPNRSPSAQPSCWAFCWSELDFNLSCYSNPRGVSNGSCSRRAKNRMSCFPVGRSTKPVDQQRLVANRLQKTVGG